MIATAPQAASLADLLAQRLEPEDDVPLVVWLDEGRRFVRFASQLATGNLIVVEARSVLAQRLALAQPPPHAILYAASRSELEPLEELVQCFGSIRTFDVNDLLTDAGISLASAVTKYARAHPDLLLAAWDELRPMWWKSGDLDLGLALHLRGRSEGDAIDLALAELEAGARRGDGRLPLGPDEADMLVAAVLQERLRLPGPGIAEELARFALIADYANVPTGRDQFGHLLEGTDRDSLSSLARRLADSRKRLDRARELLQRAQDQLHGSLAGFSIGELATLRLVPGRIEALRAAIQKATSAAGPAKAFEFLRTQGQAFGDDDALAPYADVLAFDSRVDQGRAWLSGQPVPEPREGGRPASTAFITAYVDALFEIDRLYRHCVAHLEGALKLACETRYREWLRDLNVAFAGRLTAEPIWHFPNPQRELGKTFAGLEGRCAVVILDALRFEMGRDVFERLPKTLDRKLEWAVAALPTKTEVGMSALVPSDGPLSLAAEGGKLVVRVGIRVTTGKPARDLIWREAGFRVLSSAELTHTSFDEERIVVFHGAVDSLGETLQDEAFPHYERLVGDIARTLSDLARRGYRVIATADHGFLTLPPTTSNKVVLGKAGDDEVRKRRYRVDPAEALLEPVISRSANDLGLAGKVTVDFPPGASVFQTQGALCFVHGGIALQELVIPVLRVAAKASSPSQSAGFRIEFPKRLSARQVRVKVAALSQPAPGTALRIRLRMSDGAVIDKPFPWQPDSDGRMTLVAMLPEDAPPGRVELEVMIDAGARLASSEVDYEPHD